MALPIEKTDYALLRNELCKIREAASFTQRQLAERLQMPQSWVAKIEVGERRIDVLEFCHFVAGCNADPSEVLTRIRRQLIRSQARPVRSGPKT